MQPIKKMFFNCTCTWAPPSVCGRLRAPSPQTPRKTTTKVTTTAQRSSGRTSSSWPPTSPGIELETLKLRETKLKTCFCQKSCHAKNFGWVEWQSLAKKIHQEMSWKQRWSLRPRKFAMLRRGPSWE